MLPNAAQPIPAQGNARRTSWVNAATNLVLVPVKQHAVCCGLLPLAVAAMGSSAAAEWLESYTAEAIMALFLPVLITALVMWGERAWHNRASNKQPSCQCARHRFSWREFGKQVLLGYMFYAVVYLAAHTVLPHHHHH